MRTPRYLPKVRNGAVAKRQARSKNSAMSKAFSAFSVGAWNTRPDIPRPRPNSRRVTNRARGARRSEGRGSRVMWLMILIGMILTAGFVFALRSQINAYKIAQAEEQLKMKLDEYAGQQKFLTLDQQRALSAGESERMGRRNGLDHLKLDRDVRRESNATVWRLVPQVQSPVREPQSDQRDRLAANGQNGPRSIKRLVKPGSQAKVVKAVKTGKTAKVVKVVKTGKTAKVVKVVKLNAVKSSGAANKARANVVRTRKRQ